MLLIKNNEKGKIIELEARVGFVTKYYLDSNDLPPVSCTGLKGEILKINRALVAQSRV
jgi:hypothetical protein